VSLADLSEPFRSGVIHFVGALRDAAASVHIEQTVRPMPRAWLMHYCCRVAGYRDKRGVFQQLAPDQVPAHPEIPIDWTHGGDTGAARAAAVAMRQAYEIVRPAALNSNHVRGEAIDMTIRFQGVIQVRDARGVYRSAASLTDLVPIGKSYGVLKLADDPPHWSIDGR
jgi:hypothetical protein